MKMPLKEPLSAKYLHISPANIVHVFMPIVSGTNIGLDNTCKAVYALQEFFGKGSNSNPKASLKVELLAYKEALESDISLLGADSSLLSQQKQERLTQIDGYLDVLASMEKHPELNCLNSSFPSYPRPLEDLMQNRTNSNLYSMVLRPTEEDGFLRSEAANPIFSVAHKSILRQRETSKSELQQSLIKAYTPLTFEAKDSKSQVMAQVLAQLKQPHVPVQFEHLRELLHHTVQALFKVDVDFSKTQQSKPIHQQEMNETMEFNSQTTTPNEYMEALFGYCAGNLFDTVVESPFNYLTQVEQWSVATQFLLGITNIYAVSQDIISTSTNFGQILDSRPDLSKSLAETLATAQKEHDCIEAIALSWTNAYATEMQLNTSFTHDDIKAIKEIFAKRYAEIKNSPHFDEFFLLDTQKKGHFVIHQGSICTNFAEFASSPLLGVPKELIQPLDKVRHDAKNLSVNISHKNSLIKDALVIDTTTLNHTQLQTLYERINTSKDPKLKEELLGQLKDERPDFKPKIDKQFLQHVAYGEQNEAEQLLQKDVEAAQELLTARNTPFTDYSGRTFTCTAYEYAYWAKDTHMCRMLERYMNDQTKQIILKQVQNIEELIGDTLFKHPRGLVYTQKGNEYCSAHFDLKPLITALKHHIDAYNTPQDWDTMDALWIQIGLPQREVPAHIAQEYCHPNRSFGDVVKNNALLDASKPVNLVRQLKFYNSVTKNNDVWFTPRRSSQDSELGFSFAILGHADRVIGLGRQLAWLINNASKVDLEAIEAIDKARTEDLKQSLANLAAPSNLQNSDRFLI
ncbi:SidC [Legionella longbeachae]|uniref:SidC n=1 Tax=Legionella longbeachae TaxID=450 RepID=UPI000A1C181F|nr:SidC [Legionella longbeachae]ARM32580.1 SidC [Legionella longbeachae]